MGSLSSPLCVISDDLADAVDAAAAWKAGHTHDTCVVMSWSDAENAPVEGAWTVIHEQVKPGMLALSTASRNLTDGEEASQRVHRAVTWASDRDFVRFKTVDGLLRGNVPEEIQAFIAASPVQSFLLAPALPSRGRVTIDGIQYANGMPVSHVSIGEEPESELRTSNVADLIPGHFPKRSLSFMDMQRGGIRSQSREALVSGGLVTADAVSIDDLVELRDGALDAGADLIGTAGLLSSLTPSPPEFLSLVDSNVLIICAEWTREIDVQLDEIASRVGGSTQIVLHPTHLPSVVELTNALSAGTRNSPATILTLSRSQDLGLKPYQEAQAGPIADRLIAEAVFGLSEVSMNQSVNLILLGGDLAQAITEASGVTALEVLGQTADGGGLCKVVGDKGSLPGTWIVCGESLPEPGSITRLLSLI